MRLPAFLDSVPRPALILAIPIVAFSVTVVLTLGTSGGGNQASAPPALAVSVSNQQPLPAAALPPAAVANRTDCNAIRGTDYRSAEERDWFQKNCATSATNVNRTTSTTTTSTTSTSAAATTSSGGGIRGSSDRLVLRRLGINAPVNYRTVGLDGAMGNPSGPYDTVWYDFSPWPGLGGYPGSGGNAVLAGHVDYRTVGAAVFFNLRKVAEGDIIEYYRGDGQVVTYSVAWITDISPDSDWNAYVSASAGDTLTLITCIGDFNSSTREYSQRRVVRAVRVS